MNILLIGGSSSVVNNLIIKMNKEGHRVYLLTGSKYKKQPYQKVFERYDFPYDSSCLNEIFDSVDPDVTIYMGAYDTNYKWIKEESEAVKYSASLMNILMAYATTANKGRFIYISSNEVYGNSYEKNIPEEEIPSGITLMNMVYAQAEEMCYSYRKNRLLDVVVMRLDNLFGIPNSKAEIMDACSRMCLEAMDKYTITIRENDTFSMLYDTDAVECIYRMCTCDEHRDFVYHISSQNEVTQKQLAEMIAGQMDQKVDIISTDKQETRKILSGKRYESEFGVPFTCDFENVVSKVVAHMVRNKHFFLYGEEKKKPFLERMKDKAGWLFKVLIPFVENIVAFFVFYYLSNTAARSSYFSNLDFYLLYVLLFAIVYGQQQATFAAALSVVGYVVAQFKGQVGIDIMLSANTYVWIAELFIVGLAVGYMRDYISKLKLDQEHEKDFLSLELSDIKDINSSNMRVKDALETQIITQNDSIGKIYSITSTLDQYSPEEVLFYAAKMISELVKSKDVAIYSVSNGQYARLFSATSDNARVLGNSVRYTELGEMYQTLLERKVFINRKLDDRYPLMANAIYNDNGEMQLLIMIWSISWERMTLGQANQLVVISSLIQNALLRANRYMAALEEERFIEGSNALDVDAFVALINAFVDAGKKGLTDCVLIQVKNAGKRVLPEETMAISSKLRQTDYVGRLPDGEMYVLLANTRNEEVDTVLTRLLQAGYEGYVVEENVQ